MSKHLELPTGWAFTRLGDVLPILYGKGLTKKQRDTSGNIPVYGSSGIVGFHTFGLTQCPTIIVGRKGSAGAVHFSDSGCWTIDTAYFAVGTKNVYLRYFYYLLRLLGLGMFDRSTTVPSLSRDDYNPIEIPLAPLPEQKRIVGKLEGLFSDLDAGVAALERARANLKRYRAAVLKAAVEGKLTEQWRKENPPKETASKLLERILAERSKNWNGKGKYKEPVQPDTNNLPKLPEGWCWVNVEQIADVKTGATPKRGTPAYYNKGTIPWITSAVVNEPYVNKAKEYITSLALKKTNTKLFPKYSLLIALYGEGKTRGKVTELLIEAATNQAIAAMIFEGTAFECKRYAKIFFQKNYEDLRKVAVGGVQPNLSIGIIKRTALPLPPLDEQDQIVSEVDSRLSIADRIEASLENDAKRSKRLRQAILKRAFEGKLVPQDPSDEPASALLERIRISRGKSVVAQQTFNRL